MASRTEQFYAACVNLPFPEAKDERGEENVPELTRVSSLLDEGRTIQAVGYARGLIRHFPGLDIPAVIAGTLVMNSGRPQDVVDIVRTALPEVPRRYRLYSLAGQAEFALGNLANACVWWSRSAIAQCMVSDYQVHTPFFYMAHVAVVVGAFHQAGSFLAMSSAIEPTAPRLLGDLEEYMEPLGTHWAAGPLKMALEYIEHNYMQS